MSWTICIDHAAILRMVGTTGMAVHGPALAQNGHSPLTVRDTAPLPRLAERVMELEGKVAAHLKRMGFA